MTCQRTGHLPCHGLQRFLGRGRLAVGMALALSVPGWRNSAWAETVASPAPWEIHWKTDPAEPDRSFVEVTGIPAAGLGRLAGLDWTPAQWQAVLSVVAETGNLATDLQLPPMAGRYRVTADAVTFTPAFPLAAAVTYRGTFRPAALPGEPGVARPGSVITASLSLPPRSAEPTTGVTAVYPSAVELPENLLKFYLHFSAPMSRGHIYDHLHLLNAAGERVELPFLEIDEELWNPEMTRLTLFLDPGRIKRGVRPLEEVGPSLVEGGHYALVIRREWRDGAGNPLREEFTKTFQVGPADREPPDPVTWKWDLPAARSREPLRLTFPEPLDQALIERVFRVLDGAGRRVSGTVTVGAGEREWSFVPQEPWRREDHQLQVPATIEDLAGNNIGKAFDVDLFERVERRVSNPVISLKFIPKAPAGPER